nr:hypothetical protein [Micromonospora sp. DSM 115978]
MRLRPLRRSDEAALYDLCSRSEFLYPFLARSRGSVARYVVRLAADPSPSHAGFVAVRLVDDEVTGEHEVLGLAGYERVGDSALAEAAAVTVDPLDSLGVRPLLLEHLAAFARQRGVTTFVEPGVAPLLRPRSVVVVGASARPRTLGYEVVRAVVASGYAGYLQVVSEQAAV